MPALLSLKVKEFAQLVDDLLEGKAERPDAGVAETDKEAIKRIVGMDRVLARALRTSEDVILDPATHHFLGFRS